MENKKIEKKVIVWSVIIIILTIAAIVSLSVFFASRIRFESKMDGDICIITTKGWGSIGPEHTIELFKDPNFMKAAEVHIILGDGIKGIKKEAFFPIVFRGGERDYVSQKKVTKLVIHEGVIRVASNSFANASSMVVHCEAKSKPSTWEYDMHNGIVAVVWDCRNNDVASNGYIYTRYDGINYVIKDDMAMVSDQREDIKKAVIPATIEYNGVKYPVTAIRGGAFSNCSSLESVEIPSSVVSIGGGAFSYCESLTEVELPNLVTELEDYTFQGCNNLKTVSLPVNLKTIGNEAFSGCSSLEVVNLPYKIESIGRSAFRGCTSLIRVFTVRSLTSIGSSAFSGCENLEYIYLYDTVSKIESYAFEGCKKIVFFCEAKEEPNGWYSDWNPLQRPILWDNSISENP